MDEDDPFQSLVNEGNGDKGVSELRQKSEELKAKMTKLPANLSNIFHDVQTFVIKGYNNMSFEFIRDCLENVLKSSIKNF